MGGALSAGDRFSTPIFLLTLFFALWMQVGANYLNDLLDFKNGVDTPARLGPKRAVQQGWISQKGMLYASCAALFCSLLCAIPLMLRAGLWSWLVFSSCVLCAVLYTGGKRPLGYLGFGEILVFVFFGPLALGGTYFLQMHTLSSSACLASLAPGSLAAAMMLANNLRDEKTDALASKKTLCVRFGAPFGRALYLFLILSAFATPLLLVAQGRPRLLLCAATPFLFTPIKKLREGKEVLQETARIFIAFVFLFCLWA